MKIRKATFEDWQKLRDINHSLWVYEHDNFTPIWNTHWPFGSEGEDYYQRIFKDEDWCIFFCEEKGKLIGYLVGKISAKNITYLNDIDSVASLEHMFIEEKYRRNGAGRELIEKFVVWVKEKKAQRIEVHVLFNNTQAVEFYRSLGFEDFELILVKKVE